MAVVESYFYFRNADNGCLGDLGRRRTYSATKVVGELLRSADPAVSEWGNPSVRRVPVLNRDGERPELKHLSKGRKINQRDSVSKRRAKAEQPKPRCKSGGCGADDMRWVKNS